MRRVWIGVLVVASCTRGTSVDDRPSPAPGFSPVPAPAPSPVVQAIDPARACGEPGSTPTSLPPKLLDGMTSQGDGVVELGHTQRIGGVEATYSTGTWIGSREGGHHGPAMLLTIDRAEANGGAWGSRPIELSAKARQQIMVGPYRIDLVASDEAKPMSAKLHVDRLACPDHLVIPPPRGSISLWASTEAIRLATIDMPNQMLQIGVDSIPTLQRITVSANGYHQSITPTPKLSRTVIVGPRTVTIDAVEPGRGTHFDGTLWVGDHGPAKFSVRARVDAAPATPLADADASAAPCGGASPNRTKAPVELAVIPKAHATATIRAGETKKLDGIELTGTLMPQAPPSRYREARHDPSLLVSSPSLDQGVSSGGGTSSIITHAPHAIVTFDAVGTPTNAFRATSYPLACPRDLALPIPTAPTHVWLSSVGHDAITFVTPGPTGSPDLRVTIDTDGSSSTLSATSPNGFANRKLDAALVGDTFSLDDLIIQVTDVTTSHDAHVPFPIAHVQLRVWRP